MCARCDRLEEENARLRRELGLSQKISDIHKVARRFRMQAQTARLVVLLYGANGRALSADFLHEQLSDTVPAYGSKLVQSRVWAARQALGADAVETVHGLGYRLSPMGRARIYQTLQHLEAA